MDVKTTVPANYQYDEYNMFAHKTSPAPSIYAASSDGSYFVNDTDREENEDDEDDEDDEKVDALFDSLL